MARKTNYRFEKSQRERKKAEKKAEKAKRKTSAQEDQDIEQSKLNLPANESE